MLVRCSLPMTPRTGAGWTAIGVGSREGTGSLSRL